MHVVAAHRPCVRRSSILAGAWCPAPGKERLKSQGRAAGHRSGHVEPAAAINEGLSSPGRLLDPATRAFFEPRLGHDFSRVRVHADSRAAESARQLNARAYTVGRNLVFGAGQYAPATLTGQRLLAHELAHTVQQQGGPNPAPIPGSAAEIEADRISQAIAAGAVRAAPRVRTAPGLARQLEARNARELSDAELQREHEQVRRWLLEHSMIESDYAAASRYFNALEDEVRRRGAGSGVTPAAQPVAVAPGGGASVSPGSVNVPAGGSVAGPGSRAAPMTAAHAGGALGEREAAFALGERGFHFVIAPSGPGAHSLTGSGFDSIAYNPATDELWLIDNKASGSLGKIEGKKATALGENLGASLDAAVRAVRGIPDFPDKAKILGRLERGLGAVRDGQPIPANLNIKLKVTNAGGYASGARNLPPGVEYEDLVGPAPRSARRANVATAKKEDVASGRPKSHADTEAMREGVGGVQSREPAGMPVRARVARGVRSIGGGIVKIAAVVLWNFLMAKLEQYIEGKVTQVLVERRMKALEPTIAAQLNEQIRVMADLQLRQPGKPLFGNIALLTTIDRCSEEELCSLEIEVTAVDVSAAKIDPPRNEQSRVWVGFGGKPTTPPPSFGPQFRVAVPRDLIRTAYSVELEPLGKDQLREVLLESIAAEESAVSGSSLTPEQLRASEQRRDKLNAQLRQIGSP